MKFFNELELRIAIKTGIAASVSFFIAKAYSHYFSRPDTFISGLWCVVTTIVVMQVNVGSTYKAGGLRLLGIYIGSILGAFFTLYFGVTILSLGISVAATIFLCSLLQLKNSYRIAGLSVAVVMLSWSIHSDSSPWVLSFFRSFDATVGILIAIIISHLVWPEQTWANIKNQYLKGLQTAKVCFVNGVKLEEQKNIHRELSELFETLTKLHNDIDDTKLDFITYGEEREHWVSAIQGLDRLSESIAVLQGIPKTTLAAICDESLAHHVKKFTETLQNIFENVQTQFLEASNSNREAIQAENQKIFYEQEKAFAEDLERFRQTRTTRNFSLQDVENFYSYFYHLHLIAKQLGQLSYSPASS